ncbi:zinc metallopeptidase [Cloacibacillus sp. An23]|uniref:zinc metallopeptidase n=1 Tax=Cloacibacillus sp. An23 TaxID=1965591 RepID=UPI000B39A7A2|nr:zinc metallopeptidase [Cloacibacillus sp. An23]OUO95238.1 zinc metallopeptidase [Cloacibacillus sp. An23]
MFYPFFDPTMILLIPALLLSFWAQFKVKGAFAKYSEVRAMSGLSAEEVSRRLLDRNGLSGVRIERVPGELSDHYDPRAKVLRLSDSVNASRSIAAIGVAAHEVGHAVQDKENYGFLKFRNAIVPAVQLCSAASMPLFFIGLIIGSLNLLNLGILLFCGVLVFHLVTLPLEFDASARALRMLRETNILSQQEIGGAKAVLDAAALTYVAALVMTVLQLVRLVALRGMNRDE